MNLGYLKVATFTPEIKVGDVEFNVNSIKKGIDLAITSGVELVVFPELCITGSTLGDLFTSKVLLDGAISGLVTLKKYTLNKQIMVFVGLPIKFDNLIYDACACLYNGEILGIIPKTNITNAESRVFARAFEQVDEINIDDVFVPFGKNVLFTHADIENLKIGVEIGEDKDAFVCPSTYHTAFGASVIVNLSADVERSKGLEDRQKTVECISKKTACAYIYCNAGKGESSTDFVFSGHSLICEMGETLAQSKPFENGLTIAEIDLDGIEYKRSKNFNQDIDLLEKEYTFIDFDLTLSNKMPSRCYKQYPFINQGEEQLLLTIQAQGLMKRIEHTHSSKAVLGLSGGLDSTLALIVAVKAMKDLGRSTKDVLAVTMPCFGTSSRTLENSIKLAKAYGVTLKKVDISKTVIRHLRDIDHPQDVHDAAYENAQARERTQVLMDMANMYNGLVVGTGDLSELALGWATYNGDHMSMYAVNGSVPKTLVRHLVKFTADREKAKIRNLLYDVLDTPVSPELLPATDDKINQVTEDIVGPYDLHDYFLYSMLEKGFTPIKIFYTAVNTFKGKFDEQTILKWLKTFTRRFFTQQFKRSCLPDGVKVSEISISPRGGLNMPSDAISKLWLDQLEKISI